jgi:phage terminase large subunit-like protein
MQSTAQRLTAAGLPVEEFPQTSGNLTAASQNLYDLIEGGNIVLYPDAGMRTAASRAVAVETGRGWRISKEKQSHKIDVIVALAMAAHAAVIGSGEPYYDQSFSGFQPDAQDDKKQPSFAVQQFRDFVQFGRTIW